MVLDRSHLSKFNLTSSCTAHSLLPYVILSEINMTALLNLSVTDITVLKASVEIESSRIKLRLMV